MDHLLFTYRACLQTLAEFASSHELPSLWLWCAQGSEAQRKRQYRVGLNLFNKRPEKGVRYLVDRGFLDPCPRAVARFLVSRKGLSKHMIGDYLGNLQCPFNMQVLECFVQELDFAGMQVDLALRKFQSYFILPVSVRHSFSLLSREVHKMSLVWYG